MVPQDSIDSVWVQLAAENNDFGWVRESKLLPRVVPDDPISEFIISLSMVTATNPFLPAIPVMVYLDFLLVVATIMVPGFSG